jgi:cytochrome P450 monooxygenase-1
MFLGPELCAEPEWREIIDAQPPATNAALGALYSFPSFLRPLINKISPACLEFHRIQARGRALITDLATKRRQEKIDPTSKAGDNILWMDELMNGVPFDLAGAQLFMSLAANPTATDVVTNALYELCAHPHFFEPLRDEIRSSIEKGSSVLDKTFVDKLKLMDSFLREVSRLNPLSCGMLPHPRTQTQSVTKDFLADIDTQSHYNANPPAPSPSKTARPCPRERPALYPWT